jgi:thiol-disulfide isomerase/thioredoxin
MKSSAFARSTVRPRRASMLAAIAMAIVAGAVSPANAEDSTVPRNASLATVLAAKDWLNGAPSAGELRGKVVLVDVFTFDCYNCQNVTPNLRSLARSKRADLVILGIHSPETAVEHDRDQVVSHLGSLGVTWPVAIDNDFALWNAYHIAYWPTQMIFDKRGTLRRVIIGDSQDAVVDATVNALLREPA